jgi:tripartite-type tricarboxylate transporter receptor subunit TctC
MIRKALASIVIAGLFGMGAASAQTYPSKPITVIVPFAAGGATDVLARFLGERLRAILGQPIIIENVTGATSAYLVIITVSAIRGLFAYATSTLE